MKKIILSFVVILFYNFSLAADSCAELNVDLADQLEDFNRAHAISEGVYSHICGNLRNRTARCISKRTTVNRGVAVAFSDLRDTLDAMDDLSCRISSANRREINDMGGRRAQRVSGGVIPAVPSIRAFVNASYPNL